MNWFIITISAYFFGAVANILDKFLLGSKRISSAPVYAFYVGLFSLVVLLFAPFHLNHGATFLETKLKFSLSYVWENLSISSGNTFVLCLVSGIIFAFGILLLFFAIEKAEASRVIPVYGAIIPIATFILGAMFGLEKLLWVEIFGFALLVFGGLLISFDLPLKIGKQKFFSGFYYAIGAGFFIAVANILFKNISIQESFISWYIWTRVGCFLGVCCLMFVPIWRKNIFKSFHSAKKNRKQAVSTSGIFIGNKIIGGASAILIYYAISLGSVTLVNALVSLQYVFVLLIAAFLSKNKAHVFQEKLLFWDWAQKIAAIAIIAIGMFLIYE